MQDRNGASPGEQPEYEGFDLEKLKRFWREWVDVYGEARDQSFRDQEYYDGDVKGTGWGHWTQAELQKLGARNQPPTTRNHIERKVHAIAGVEQRTRAEPRAFPRTPQDQKAAEIATDALRFAKERARLNVTSQLGMLDLLISGYCASEIEGAKDSIRETHIEWRDFAFDPRSRRADFSDARWLAVGKWLDADIAVELYAGPEVRPPQIPPQPSDPIQAQEWALMAQAALQQFQRAKVRRDQVVAAIESTAMGGRGSEIAEHEYDDHPNEHFGDAQRKRVFVVDMWHRDTKYGWYRCVFTGSGKLFSEPATLVEKDDWGRPVKVPPIKAQSLFVSKHGWRFGVVRGMRSPQDEVNFRLSKRLHWLATNQLLYEPGALGETDREVARREVSKPDGVIPVGRLDGVRIERGLDVAAALSQAQEDAERFLEMSGPNPQLQGEQGRATSGRAVLALQQAGLGALGPIFDRFHDWEDRRYRAYWFRIQQFWTAPMYVRVTDDRNAARFAAVNGAPVIHENNGSQAPMMGHNGGPPMGPEDMGGPMGGMPLGGQPPMPMGAMPPQMGAPQPMQEATGPILAELDMDIIIDRAPESATLQAEQFETLSQLAQAGVLGPPNPQTGRLIVTASALPNKTELLDMLEKMEQQQTQSQGPSPQDKAMLAKLAAEIEKLISESRKNKAQAAKTEAEIPKARTEGERAAAQARTENLNATMNEIGASDVLTMSGIGAPAYGDMNTPPAAAETGAFGLPPSEAIGPPPI